MSFSYQIRFSREKEIKYISHLDMMRLWYRCIRRSNLPVTYSQGFNPHIKFSLALPLSVGMTSSDEYADLQLETFIAPDKVLTSLKASTPRGLGIHSCDLSKKTGTSASRVAAVEYEIYLVESSINEKMLAKKLDDFLHAEEVIILKKSKNGEKQINIRPLILNAAFSQKDSLITIVLNANSGGALNPDYVLQALNITSDSVNIHRTKIQLQA